MDTNIEEKLYTVYFIFIFGLENFRDGEPDGLLSMGLHRVGHNWCDLAAAAAADICVPGFPGSSDGKESACNAGDPASIPGFGRSSGKGHGNPLLSLSGKSYGQSSLSGYSPWGRKESDITERLTLSSFAFFFTIRMYLPFCLKLNLTMLRMHDCLRG